MGFTFITPSFASVSTSVDFYCSIGFCTGAVRCSFLFCFLDQLTRAWCRHLLSTFIESYFLSSTPDPSAADVRSSLKSFISIIGQYLNLLRVAVGCLKPEADVVLITDQSHQGVIDGAGGGPGHTPWCRGPM